MWEGVKLKGLSPGNFEKYTSNRKKGTLSCNKTGGAPIAPTTSSYATAHACTCTVHVHVHIHAVHVHVHVMHITFIS